jgi:hypothetical protein
LDKTLKELEATINGGGKHKEALQGDFQDGYIKK